MIFLTVGVILGAVLTIVSLVREKGEDKRFESDKNVFT